MTDIIFLKEDTLKEKAEKTVQIWAGTDNLRKELAKLNVTYSKVNKGVYVTYVLRNKEFGKTIVKL